MLNVIDLENRWRKHKIKSYIPYAVIAFSLIIIIFTFLMLFSSEKQTAKTEQKRHIKKVLLTQKQPEINTTNSKKQPKKTKTVKIEKEIKENKIVKQKQKVLVQKPEIKKDKKLVLAPSLKFMRYMQSNTPEYYENENPNTQEIKTYITPRTIQKEPKKAKQQNTAVVKQKRDAGIIVVNRDNTLEDIQEVIKRFKINNNPALSLFVAKKYYELGQYNKAYNYALITNEINPNIEASWIIFAKSLVKLNEKEMAKRTLKRYIQNSHSNNAQILLNNINSGKFK